MIICACVQIILVLRGHESSIDLKINKHQYKLFFYEKKIERERKEVGTTYFNLETDDFDVYLGFKKFKVIRAYIIERDLGGVYLK